MAKRLLSLVVLVSMFLQCASRLGILASLYEKRNEIAYAIGLKNEKPITICSSNYAADKVLAVTSVEHGPEISGVAHAHTIVILFCIDLSAGSGLSEISFPRSFGAFVPAAYDLVLVDSVFHPPLG